MAKSFTASATQLKPDPRFGSILISKFINCLMHDGKKGVAMKAFYDAMEIVAKRGVAVRTASPSPAANEPANAKEPQ